MCVCVNLFEIKHLYKKDDTLTPADQVSMCIPATT